MLTSSARSRGFAFLAFVLLASAAGMLVACNDGYGTDPPPPPSQITVSMRDNSFQQRVDTIAVNGTVTWRNDGAVSHTSTSDAAGWDSGSVAPAGTFPRQFTQAGSFPYHCTIHGSAGSGMAGTIVVR